MVLVLFILNTIICQLNRHLNDSQNISWSAFLPEEGRQDLKENVWCAKNTGKGENLLFGVVNVRQGCV
jgi:hypothetical protein